MLTESTSAPPPTGSMVSATSLVIALGEEGGPRNIGELFDIGDVLGRGAYGEVRQATQRSTGVEVALKCIPREAEPSLAEKLGNVLLRCLLEELVHPNIVKFYAFAEDDVTSYVAMTLLKGMPLSAYFGEYAPLSVRHAADVLGQGAAAISFLHEKGLVHRDVKPDNFVFEEIFDPSSLGQSGSLPTGLIKLLDFGSVASAGQTVDKGVGSIGFCAPEVFKGQCIPAADAFSFGAMISIALTCAWPAPMQPNVWLELMDENDPASVEVYRKAIEDMSDAELKSWAAEELPEHPELAEILARLLIPDASVRASAEEAKQVFERVRDGAAASK